MQAPAAKAEVLDDVEYFHWFFRAATLLLLSNDKVDIDIGVNKVTIGTAPHCALDSH